MYAKELTIYNAIIVGFLAFGAVLAFFIISMIKQHRRNIELYKAKVAAEISTMENERMRIATDLHDDLGPILSVIKLKISDIKTNKEDAKLVKQAEIYLDDVVHKLRQISNDLMPGTLLRKGLPYAIEEFVQKVGELSVLMIRFTHKDIPVLPEQVSINLYRIILEIIHNAMKHSEAIRLDIKLSCSENKLRLETKDNGKGFDVSKADENSNGLGLRNILNRTELLGGEMFLESAKGEGTVYNIVIPI